MVELLPSTDSPGHRAVAVLLEGLSGTDVPLPPLVLVDDGVADWGLVAATLSVERRRRSVLATASEVGLWEAVRLEIGGATWLPASTPSLSEACAAAATAETPALPQATWGVMESVVEGADRLWGIGWPPLSFWNRQTGPARMLRCLRRIADRLRCPAAVAPGPVLVIGAVDRDRVEAASRDACGDGDAVPVPPSVNDLTPVLALLSGQRSAGTTAALRRWSIPDSETAKLSFPVMELPSGRPVGRWLPPGGVLGSTSGWCAVPDRDRPDATRWRIDGGGLDLPVRELGSSAEIASAGHEILRLSGRIGAELRPGSPAALLTERVARHQARAGRPVWISGVDPDGVRLLLGLPGPIWVDGPGVPRD